MHVTGPNDRNIAGHIESSFPDRFDGADCNRVVVTKYPIRGWLPAQQLPHAFISGFISKAAFNKIAGLRFQAVFYQCLTVSFETSYGNADSGAMQVSNATAALGNKMRGGEPANHLVINSHERSIHSSNGTVNQNVGDLPLLNLLKHLQAVG